MNFSDFGVPPGPFGGVLGGCIVPGAPEVWSVTFFCLLCLNDNNYSKIFPQPLKSVGVPLPQISGLIGPPKSA